MLMQWFVSYRSVLGFVWVGFAFMNHYLLASLCDFYVETYNVFILKTISHRLILDSSLPRIFPWKDFIPNIFGGTTIGVLAAV